MTANRPRSRPTPRLAREGIVEAGWRARADLVGCFVFPPLLDGGFWEVAARGFPEVVTLAPRNMQFE